MKHLIITLSILLTFCLSFSQDMSDSVIKKYGNIVKDTNIIVRVIGLDKFDSTKLFFTKKIIKNTFGFKTYIINEPIKLEALYIKGTDKIDLNQISEIIYNDTLTIYLTEHQITDDEDSFIVGATARESSTIMINSAYVETFLNTTIIHEIGHMYGLSHCDNNYCVMADSCLGSNNTRFCKKCTDKMYK